ncbi:MAG: hypothetical protein GY941_10995 [Planctomycetes bacterium]|nr:hypothetical protein [Planctomycetota bacterium]
MKTPFKVFFSHRFEEMNVFKLIANNVANQFNDDLDYEFVRDKIFWSSEKLEEFLAKEIYSSQLFIGIYGRSSGKAYLELEGLDKELSPIEFEFQVAEEHFGNDMILFVKKDDIREQRVKDLLGKRIYNEFETERDFEALLKGALIKWLEVKKKEQQASEYLLSIETNSPDKPDILSRIYTVISNNNDGEVIRVRQTIHLADANVKVMARWFEEDIVDEENKEAFRSKIDKAITKLLTSLYKGELTPNVNVVAVGNRKGEVTHRGNFVVRFYDRKKMAKDIFGAFSVRDISVLECSLDEPSETSELSKFNIKADLTESRNNNNVMVELKKHIIGLKGVCEVEGEMETGNWWY